MTKEMDSAQILRHLEEDMSDLLGLFELEDVYEIMLNPYRREDGLYEGHIWYERGGLGMLRLTKEHRINLTAYPRPIIGDKVFYRYCEEDGIRKILNYHVIASSGREMLEAVGIVLKNSLLIDKDNIPYLEQEEHYKLNVLADNIAEKAVYRYKQPIPEQDIKNPIKLVNQINQRLEKLIGITFRVDMVTIRNREELEQFNLIPQYAMAKEFVKMTASKAEQIMSILAAANSKHFHAKEPRLECPIPFYHHRFTGQCPPMVKFPSFTIRRHSSEVVPLDDYVSQGILPAHCAATIRDWIIRGYNILIAGGTGVGKTRLLNSLILETARIHPQSLCRVGIIEDTPEIQNPIENAFEFSKTNEVTMDDCLNAALRSRPNSIIVGEVRGAEAYTLFKAMLTGHRDCYSTIHASGAYECTYRFEHCIKEHPDCRDMPVQRGQIALALNGIISIQKTTVRVQKNGYWENVIKRKVTALREITGYDAKHDVYEDIVYYQDKEAIMEQIKPVNNTFARYQ